MKRIFLLLTLITQFTFSQVNTTTTTVGKLKMNIPDPGAKKDSIVVWDGTTKLLKFRPVSQITGTTNLDQLVSPTGISVFSSTGTDIVLPLATSTNAGLLAPAEKTKLAGIAAGATANQTDAYLLARANHTGTQAIATVTGLQTALDGKEPTMAAGTTSQYYRGDKTFQTLDKTAVGLGNVDNTSDVNKPISTATQTALNTKQDLSTKGVANGYAGLDASGKVPLTQINDALLGSVNYQGTYNAATNTPALPTVSTSNKGYYFVISAAGTQAGLTLSPGDWIISNGTAWGKVDNNNAVTAVNGATGNVILTTSNITEGTNLYYTDARVNANASVAASATARHNAVTIGTANGLSLSTQQLSLGLASTSTTGALSSTDWNTFNNKPSSTGTGASGTWGINISGSAGTSVYTSVRDIRTISPSSATTGTMSFGFTSWNNNNTPNWADYLHMRSYNDATGGSDNLVMFSRIGIGMRLWQQNSGSTTPYSSYKDVAFTDGSNASGTWGINISGNSQTANSANTWGGNQADFSSYGTALSAFVAYDGDTNKNRHFTVAQVKSSLGLSNYMSLDLGYTGNLNSVTTLAGKLYAATNAANAYGPFLSFGGGQYVTQINSQPSKNGIAYIRVSGDGGLGDWRQLWHDGNFNPSNYLPLTGGTLSGSLNVNGTISTSPATEANQVVVKSQLDAVAGTSGEYIPTVTYGGNLATINIIKARYIKIGNIVQVAVVFSGNNTAVGLTSFLVTLPFNKTSINTSFNYGTSLIRTDVGYVESTSPFNDRVRAVLSISSQTGNFGGTLNFMYNVTD